MLKRLIRSLVRGAAKSERRHPPSVSGPVAAVVEERARAAFDRALEQIERGQPEAAERFLHEAIALNPGFAEAHYRLGRIYGQKGALDDAADCHELAIYFDPRNIQAHAALAGLRKSQGRHGEAIEHYRSIVELDPNDAATHTNLCLALHEVADYDAARQHGERAIAADPKLPEAHHNLGLVLRELGDPARALQHFEKAMEFKPRAEIAAGLAHAYRDLGRLKEAIANYERALRLNPDLGDATINRAYAFLLNGNYSRGWEEYENRFVATGAAVRDFGLARWNGESLQGRTILVYAEQGLGDEIMFASCLPDLLAQADRVIVECNERLAPLFKRSFPRATVIGGTKGDPTDWIRQYAPVHFQLPVGSLPRWYRSTRTAFPSQGRYLSADPKKINHWRDQLKTRKQLHVGLSWRGGGAKTRGYLRSVSPALLAPLVQLDAAFVCLQHDVQLRELNDAQISLMTMPGITEHPDELAALISALDLVISVDNTTAQLAGALGQRLWIMLSASPEWRYGISGETMPWYPSAKLFRQGDDRRWEPVITQVAAAFSAWSESLGTAP